MQQAALFALIIRAVDAGLAAQGITNVTVQQSLQPTQQGVPSGPTAAVFKVADKRYGFLKRKDVWVPIQGAPFSNGFSDGFPVNNPNSPGYMGHEESQWMESTFQITCLVPQITGATRQMAAADLADACANALQSDAGRAILREEGVGVLRVTDIRAPAFLDDRDRHEYAPNFDFTLTHENVRLSSSPIVQNFDFDLQRV